MPKCADCIYWEEFLEAEEDFEADGYCHRYPPTLQPDLDGSSDYEFRPTQTKENYWCGEFKVL